MQTNQDNWISIRNLDTDCHRSIEHLKQDRSRLLASRAIVENALNDGKVYYSINTGFGVLANKLINQQELTKLQTNLLLSHPMTSTTTPPASLDS